MVYRGRPSRGCEACRQRKSRCDQLPDGCTHCKRAKRECIYRELSDIIFHNESDKVVRKAKLEAAKHKARTNKSDFSLPTQAKELRTSSYPQLTDLTTYHAQAPAYYTTTPSDLILLPSVNDVAAGFFVYNFVLQPHGENGPRRFDYIEDGYLDYTMNEGLLSSMQAVGLALYAHTVSSTNLLNRALYQYGHAIKLTNNSLVCAEAAKKDTTLLSILVLGIFETVTGCKQRSLREWSQHIAGAAAVVSLRGRDQIKTNAGRNMLFQVTANLVITCMAQGRPVPKFIVDYNRDAVELIDDPEPSLLVQQVMIATAQTRAEFVSRTYKDLDVMLGKIVDLDDSILSMMVAPPAGWLFEVVSTDIKASFLWNGKYHVYRDCWVAQLWNGLRAARIVLNELIRQILLEGFSTKPPIFQSSLHTARFQLATDSLYGLQADILYSIPQYLFTLSSSPRHQKEGRQPQHHETRNPVETMQGKSAFVENEVAGPPNSATPSSVAGSSPQSPSSLQDTVVDQFSLWLTSPPTAPNTTSSQLHPQTNSQSQTQSTQNLSSHDERSTSQRDLPRQGSSERQDSPFDDSNRTTNAARTYSGNLLMWPLWFAGVMDVATDEVKAFVVKNLRDIGDTLGIKHGFVLADLIEKGSPGGEVIGSKGSVLD